MISQSIQQAYNEAVKRGNEFKGYSGIDPAELSREEIEMMCTILFDGLMQLTQEVSLVKKRLALNGDFQ